MKLTLVLAAAFLFVAAAHASLIENPMRTECRKQMRMMRPQLDQCERYMTMEMDGQDSNPMACRGEECMRGCCQAMREMDEECMCMWMKGMLHQMRGEMGQEDARMMMRKMRMMPTRCGMGGRMSCDMGSYGRRDYD